MDGKNKRRIFNEVEVLDPSLVVTLGMVFDEYKKPMAPELWRMAEQRARAELGAEFDPLDHFHSDSQDSTMGDSEVTIERRYYTPASNRKRLAH